MSKDKKVKDDHYVLMGSPRPAIGFDDPQLLDDPGDPLDGFVYTEKDHPGRKECDTLREIRRLIAEINDIEFHPAECHHVGPCQGTCPVCDSELRYIDEELQKKKARGETVILAGIAKAAILEDDDNAVISDDEHVVSGQMINPDACDSGDLDW